MKKINLENLLKNHGKNLFGRVLKVKNEGHKISLHANPNQKCIFVFGYDTIEYISKNNLFETPNEILLSLGLTREYIRRKVSNKWNFEMLIFVKDGILSPFPADWEGIGEFIKGFYKKEIYELFKKFQKELEIRDFKEYENGHKYPEILSKGANDDEFVTPEKLLKMSIEKNEQISLSEFRKFLFLNFSLKELFTGKGYTLDENNKMGFNEYIMRNVKRKDFTESENHFIPLKLDEFTL